MRLRATILLLLLAGVGGGVAHAACGAPFLFASAGFDGGDLQKSYVLTPGVDPATSVLQTSVTERLQGFFWALGFGDPTAGLGHDSGTFEALGNPGWLYIAPRYPAFILGTWAASAGIDGCVSATGVAGPDRCMAILLTDVVDDVSYFAAMAKRANPLDFDYYLLRPDAAPYVLAEIPAPRVLAEERVAADTLLALVSPPVIDAGLFPDPECDHLGSLPVGYRIYRQTLASSVAAPAERSVSAGWSDPTAVIDLDTDAVVTLPCDDDRVSWLATTLVFESGFETPVVSANSAPVACQRCELGSDDDGDGHCTATNDGSPTDCDDTDRNVYPGATQICDGAENDCLAADWPNVPAGEADNDGDGYLQCGGDCADLDPSRNPGSPEICNDLDDDCDGAIDEDDMDDFDTDADGVPNACDNCASDPNPGQGDVDADGRGDSCDGCDDRDGDGWGDPGSNDCPNGAQTDCDDLDRITRPGGVEYDDGKDNDCDDAIDEGVDSDGDGVPDFRDACAGTPPAVGVDPAGCDVCPAPTVGPPVPGSRSRPSGREAARPESTREGARK